MNYDSNHNSHKLIEFIEILINFIISIVNKGIVINEPIIFNLLELLKNDKKISNDLYDNILFAIQGKNKIGSMKLILNDIKLQDFKNFKIGGSNEKYFYDIRFNFI